MSLGLQHYKSVLQRLLCFCLQCYGQSQELPQPGSPQPVCFQLGFCLILFCFLLLEPHLAILGMGGGIILSGTWGAMLCRKSNPVCAGPAFDLRHHFGLYWQLCASKAIMFSIIHSLSKEKQALGASSPEQSVHRLGLGAPPKGMHGPDAGRQL